MHAACCTEGMDPAVVRRLLPRSRWYCRATKAGEQRWCMRGQVWHGLPPLVSDLCLEERALVIAFHGYYESDSEGNVHGYTCPYLFWVSFLRITQPCIQMTGGWADCSCVWFSAYDFICVSQTPFQSSGLDTSRTTRHHGLVDRVYRDRNRLGSPHRRPLSVDKHGRQISFGSGAGRDTRPLHSITSQFLQLPSSSLLTCQQSCFPSQLMSSAFAELWSVYKYRLLCELSICLSQFPQL